MYGETFWIVETKGILAKEFFGSEDIATLEFFRTKSCSLPIFFELIIFEQNLKQS